jgi:NADPH:quinone reductase-like Zn-dependent oxidoreductase
MKAIVCPKYGSPDVLQFKEVERPIPKENEVLVKIFATSVNRTDSAYIRGKPFFTRVMTGLIRPNVHIPGTEFSGKIEKIGKNVQSFRVGDRVFGLNDMGAKSHAEYLTIPEEAAIAIIPEEMTFEQVAGGTEGAHYAYNFINKVPLELGNSVLVNGATGAIGSAAVQLLKAAGCDITAVCNTKNMELVRSLGTNRVIDHTKEDFTKGNEKYHFVFDTVGKSSFFKCRSLLLPGGVYISSDLGFLCQNIILPLITPIIQPLIGGKRTVFPIPEDGRASILFIRRLMEEGKFKPVIDRTYPFDEIIEAYRYVETGQKTGNVVITILDQ